MRYSRWMLLTCAAGLALGGAGGAIGSARAADVMGKEASECEIAAALNISKAGCGSSAVARPGAKTRGLAIGNIDAMPPGPTSAAPVPASMPKAPTPPAEPRVAKPAPAVAAGAAAGAAEARPAAPRPAARERAEPQRSGRQDFQIGFEFGSTNLTSDSIEILDRIGAVLAAPTAQNVRFRIVGHTDGVGNAENNQALSERRAEAVKKYLMDKHNVPDWRLEAIGRGESELLNRRNPNADENRRVELINLGA